MLIEQSKITVQASIFNRLPQFSTAILQTLVSAIEQLGILFSPVFHRRRVFVEHFDCKTAKTVEFPKSGSNMTRRLKQRENRNAQFAKLDVFEKQQLLRMGNYKV